MAERRLDAVQVAQTARFVTKEASKIHSGFGGSSQFDNQRARFEHPTPYKNLERALKAYAPSILDIELSNNYTLDSIFDRVCDAEARCHPQDNARDIFRNAWLKVGEFEGEISPWIDLIPDSYGLAVVKSGIAIILKMAAKSAEKRQRIFTTFAEIRDFVVREKSQRMLFLTDPSVSRCATELYIAIVDAVEDLLRSFPVKTPFQWSHYIPRFAIKRHPESPETILQRVKDSASKLQYMVQLHHEEEFERISRRTKNIDAEAKVIRRDLKNTEINTREINGKLGQVSDETNQMHTEVKGDFQKQEIKSDEIIKLLRQQAKRQDLIANGILNNRLIANNGLLQFLLERLGERRALERRRNNSTQRSSKAVVTLERLFFIISKSAYDLREPLESTFFQSNKDLELASMYNTNTKAQGQAQSVLLQPRFTEWLQDGNPDLLLIDANIRGAALSNMSAMSLFCAYLVASMIKLQPDDVVSHFFCGLHTASSDPWYGPSGLVRSLIVQLLMALHERELLDLDFIRSRLYLKGLKEHKLENLCQLLHDLIRQLPSETAVYCIIDGIGCLDKGSGEDLCFVIEWLKYIVGDDSLPTNFKVLMTNPEVSTKRLRDLFLRSQQLTLNASYLNSLAITDRSVEAFISRPATSPTPQGSKTNIEQEEYDEGGDDW